MHDFLSLPRNAKLFLVTQFLVAGYYTWPFWYGFAIEAITPTQFGIYLAVAYLVGVIAEVPTGAFGDTFGRKKSVIIGILCHAPMLGFVFFGHDFASYLIAAVFSGIGGAFISGSLESEIYDSEGVTPQVFRKVMKYEIIAWQTGLILATALGGLMFELWRPLPFIAETASFLIAIVAVILIKPATYRATEVHFDSKIKKYINQNIKGFAHLFEVKQLRSLLAFWCCVSIVVWVGVENTNEAGMIHLGVSPEFRGYLIAATKTVVLVVLNLLIFKAVTSDRHKLLFVFLSLVGAFALYSIDNKALFLLGFIMFNLAASTMDNFIKPIIHDHLESRWRATAISSFSFIKGASIGLCLLAVGWGIESFGIVSVHKVMFIFITLFGSLSLMIFLRKLNDKSWQRMEQSPNK